jgi:hypothetical protein
MRFSIGKQKRLSIYRNQGRLIAKLYYFRVKLEKRKIIFKFAF